MFFDDRKTSNITKHPRSYNKIQKASLQFDYKTQIQRKSIELCETKNGRTARLIKTGSKLLFGATIIFFASMKLPRTTYALINLQYILHNAFKIYLFLKHFGWDEYEYNHISTLPIYSILIPLYKELNKLDDIMSAMLELEYPEHKLDIKIIIEEDDTEMIRATSLKDMPWYFHIIVVPNSFPKTKPKALNYAMFSIIGEYVVVYDAEDIPQTDQLLKAVTEFHHLPYNYACLQCALTIHNHDENLLTKMLGFEYGVWFSCILKGLELADMPVALGGTSNHFKAEQLKEVGLWDPYNVTEDADLGVRLYIKGYKVKIIDSETYEEAPHTIFLWMKQRIRWIKGFVITFFVHCNNISFAKPNLSIFLLLFLLGSFLNALLLPWLLFFDIIFGEVFKNTTYLSLLLNFLANYGILAIYIIRDHKFRYTLKDIIAFILFPLYFVMHAVVGYYAIYELVTNPFFWNKTNHRSVGNSAITDNNDYSL